MTQNELRERIVSVAKITKADEAEREVLRLYVDVLKAIANGALYHRRLARDVLELEHMRVNATR